MKLVGDYVKKHFKLFALGIFVVGFFGLGAVVTYASSLLPNELVKASEEMFTEAVREAISGELTSLNDKVDSKDNHSVIVLERALNKYRTAEEFRLAHEEWRREGWDSQIGAMKAMARNPIYIDILEPLIIEEDVFKEFLRTLSGVY